MPRNVLMTGGTGKIATELLKGLLDDGHNVTLTTRSINRAKQHFSQLNLNEDKLEFVEIDLLRLNEISFFVESLNNPVDTIIHNARSLEFLTPDSRGQMTPSQLENEFKLAVIAPYLLNNELLNSGYKLRDIIFLSSIYGIVAPNPKLYTNFKVESPINYGIAKASQIHLAKELAVRLSLENVRVNVISYGGVEGRVNDNFKKKYSEMNPMGRMLNKCDLYPPIQFLINNYDLAITGQNIQIDGGWTVW